MKMKNVGYAHLSWAKADQLFQLLPLPAARIMQQCWAFSETDDWGAECANRACSDLWGGRVEQSPGLPDICLGWRTSLARHPRRFPRAALFLGRCLSNIEIRP